MKTFVSTILMITTCTLLFHSCSKKKDVTPPFRSGSVVFWTKNAALLSACSNNITIRLIRYGPYGGGIIGASANIINVNASAPSSCNNMSSAIENTAAYTYNIQIKDCATDMWVSPPDQISIVSGECLKFEIL